MFSKLYCSPSPEGMAGGKYRSFLVHIKAVSDRGMEESPRPVVRMPCAKPQGTKAHSLSTLLQRAQASKVHITASSFLTIGSYLEYSHANINVNNVFIDVLVSHILTFPKKLTHSH